MDDLHSLTITYVIIVIGACVRIDHDMWWLEGRTHMKHKNDKRSIVKKVVAAMASDILDGSLVGAYLHHLRGVPILFTHAGIGEKFYGFLQRQLLLLPTRNNPRPELDPRLIEQYCNELLVSSIQSCDGKYPCR